jgi:hypothetical protein
MPKRGHSPSSESSSVEESDLNNFGEKKKPKSTAETLRKRSPPAAAAANPKRQQESLHGRRQRIHDHAKEMVVPLMEAIKDINCHVINYVKDDGAVFTKIPRDFIDDLMRVWQQQVELNNDSFFNSNNFRNVDDLLFHFYYFTIESLTKKPCNGFKANNVKTYINETFSENMEYILMNLERMNGGKKAKSRTAKRRQKKRQTKKKWFGLF